MPGYRRQFDCEVISPYRSVFRGPAVGAKLPALDGSLGILGGRAPLVAYLGTGMVSISQIDGPDREFYVSRGFAKMDGDELILLAEDAVPLSELDAEQAWDDLQAAQRMPAETDEQIARREQAIADARVRFNLAQRGRRKQREAMESLGSLI